MPLWGSQAPLLLHHPASLKTGPSEERAAPENGATPGGTLGNACRERRSEVLAHGGLFSISCFALHNGGSCVWMKTDGEDVFGRQLGRSWALGGGCGCGTASPPAALLGAPCRPQQDSGV